MNRQIAFQIIIAFFLIALFSGCSPSPPPETFIETDSPEALTLEISSEYLADDVWKIVRNLMQNNFGLDRESEKDGFIRTLWQYPVTGKLTKCYRVRLTIQFSEDRYTLSILPEAEFQQKALLGIYRWWISGEDSSIGNEYYGKLKKLVGKIP